MNSPIIRRPIFRLSESNRETLAPKAEAYDAPQPEIDGLLSIQHVGCQRAHAGGIEKPGIAPQGSADAFHDQGSKRTTKPSGFWSSEPKLVHPFAHNIGKNTLHRAAQDAFSLCPNNFMIIAEPKR